MAISPDSNTKEEGTREDSEREEAPGPEGAAGADVEAESQSIPGGDRTIGTCYPQTGRF